MASFQNIQPVTTILVVLQIAVFVYQMPGARCSRTSSHSATRRSWKGKEYWRCITATFSHLGILHVNHTTQHYDYTTQHNTTQQTHTAEDSRCLGD